MAASFVEMETKYKRGTRVVATEALRGVPEGTAGNVRIAVGLTWLRYRVSFDNGADVGTVSHDKLVREGDWENFKANRAQIEAEAAEAAKRKAEAPKASPAPAAGGGDDRLAAMLARSKAAKEAKTGAAPEQPAAPTPAEAPAEGGGDDRLAAMLARSKAAKEAKGL